MSRQPRLENGGLVDAHLNVVVACAVGFGAGDVVGENYEHHITHFLVSVSYVASMSASFVVHCVVPCAATSAKTVSC
jgi:hypothetical protein